MRADILEIDEDINAEVVYIEVDGSFGFAFKDEDGDIVTEPFDYYHLNKLEVLGNAYDNPNLLGAWIYVLIRKNIRKGILGNLEDLLKIKKKPRKLTENEQRMNDFLEWIENNKEYEDIGEPTEYNPSEFKELKRIS